jgi:nitrate/nitrite transporter NarK
MPQQLAWDSHHLGANPIDARYWGARIPRTTVTGFKAFLKTGHSPTLFASFLYFSFSCCIWVLNGAMAPFISETYQLSPAQKGLMLSIPIIAGALMRFPLGVLAQYIGRKNATLVEMGLIAVAMLFGFFFVDSFNDLLAMGVLLGIAGASFGVALSLGSGSFPPRHKGLAMGLVGAGNIGTAVSVLVAPPLAQAFGWQSVYGIAAVAIAIPMVVMITLAKEPPDVDNHASFREHIACLFEKDGWAFSVIYGITFGGFIGLTTFLPTYYFDQFGVSKVEAGQLTMLAAFMGATVRVFGGWISDRQGGIRGPLADPLHAAVHAVFRGPGRGQRGPLPARAAALASRHGGGRVDDRRDRGAGRRPRAERDGPVEAAHRHLPLGFRGVRGPRPHRAADDAAHAASLDTHMG